MSKYVRDTDGRLWPSCIADMAPVNLPPGACTRCYGSGQIRETVDEDRHDEMVPCFMCMTFCKKCRNWVKKKGHECKGE